LEELMAKANAAAPLRRSADRRAAILAVAWEVFLEQGYGGASMSDIAERLGGSKGTLYNYFRSKEEIFLAVLLQRSSELYTELSCLPANCGDLAKDLTDFGCQLLDIVLSEDYLALYRLVVAEAARFPMLGATDYEKRRQTMLGPLSARLQDDMRAERLRIADPLEAAEVFWNLCSATMHRRVLVATAPALSRDEVRHLVERAVSIFLAAYGLPMNEANPEKPRQTRPRR
jgi:AcrR family transcriptional regulator